MLISVDKAAEDSIDSIERYIADESFNRRIEAFIIENLKTNFNITKPCSMFQFYNSWREKNTIVQIHI